MLLPIGASELPSSTGFDWQELPLTRKMIIDTDTAADDAVALVMALRHPDIEVVAITLVAGNVSLQQVSKNARYTMELCDRQVPVYEGAEKPLQRKAYRASFYHGDDGMGNMHYPDPKQPPETQHAVDAVIEHITANPGIILVTLGPLTNIAMALEKAPEIVNNISRCVVMGGVACSIGNITPAAEYNVWCDPEAARICFHSGMPIEMVGWELCRGEARITTEEMQYFKQEINTPLAHFAMDCNRSGYAVNSRRRGEEGITLPDPVAMAIAIDPDICMRKNRHYVEIECQGEFTRGMTVIDQLEVVNSGGENVSMWQPLVDRGEPNVMVCWAIDIPRWKALLQASVQ